MNLILFWLCVIVGLLMFSNQFSKGTEKGLTVGLIYLLCSITLGTYLGWLLK